MSRSVNRGSAGGRYRRNQRKSGREMGAIFVGLSPRHGRPATLFTVAGGKSGGLPGMSPGVLSVDSVWLRGYRGSFLLFQ